MNERAPSLAPWLLWLGVSACVDPREGTVLRDAYLDDTSWIDPSRPQDTGGAADGQHGDSRDGRDGADPADTVSVSDGRTPLEEGACVRLHHVSEPVDFGVVDVGGSRDTVVSVSNCGSVEIGPLWLRIGGEHPQAYRIVVPPPAGSSVVGVAGDYELARLGPGESRSVTLRFAPPAETATFGCADDEGRPLPALVRAGLEVPIVSGRLEVTAGVGPDAVSDALELVGAGRFVDEAGCRVGLALLSAQPAVATWPIELRLSPDASICYAAPSVDVWSWSRGGGAERLEYASSETDPLRASWTFYEAGVYTLVGVVWPYEEQACYSPEFTVEVDPLDGFVARLTWTHDGVTVPDPEVDARLELHIARLDPFPAGTTPPWRSSQWATWPEFPHKVHDGAEVDTWPGESLSAVATAEYLKPGQRFAIGVAGLAWPVQVGDARPGSAEARLEIWVRGRLELTRTVTVAPGQLVDLARLEWGPKSGALFELVQGPD